MWELDHKRGWVLKNWCFQTVVLEKTLESPLDCKENKPVNPKRNQPWIFIGRTDTEAPIFWPLDGKSWLTIFCKRLRPEEKGATEDDSYMASSTKWTLSLSKLREMVKERKAWHVAVHGVAKRWTLRSDGTITTTCRGSQRNVTWRGDYNWELIYYLINDREQRKL